MLETFHLMNFPTNVDFSNNSKWKYHVLSAILVESFLKRIMRSEEKKKSLAVAENNTG